jgi:hypothetical protein
MTANAPFHFDDWIPFGKVESGMAYIDRHKSIAAMVVILLLFSQPISYHTSNFE